MQKERNQFTTFMAACRDFFGSLHSTQTLMEFHKEIKALTPKDRAEITDGLQRVGYTYVKDDTPTPPAVAS